MPEKLCNKNKKSLSKNKKRTNRTFPLLLAKMKPNCYTRNRFWESRESRSFVSKHGRVQQHFSQTFELIVFITSALNFTHNI